MKKVIALVLSLGMVVSLLAGCGASSDSATSEPASAPAEEAAATGETPDLSDKLVYFIPKVTGNSFFESANDGSQAFAADPSWGFTIQYEGSPNADVTDQITCINNAINAGADAIVLSAVDATGLDAAMKEAADAGIVVCTWDSDITTSARQIMVSQGSPKQLGDFLIEQALYALKAEGKDPEKDEISYVWHYSNPTVTDQNSWVESAQATIKEKYPNWTMASPDYFYSNQDSDQAVSTGEAILEAYPDVDLIMCPDSTAMPGQAQAIQNKGLTKADVCAIGFATPNAVADFIDNGIIDCAGLWDTAIQGGIACYVGAYLAAGNELHVGDKLNIPQIGEVTVVENGEISEGAETGDVNNGVIFLPERTMWTADNVHDYNF